MSSPRSLSKKLALTTGALGAALTLGAFGSTAAAGAAPTHHNPAPNKPIITDSFTVIDSSNQTLCDVYSYFTPGTNKGEVNTICRTKHEPVNVVPNCPPTPSTKPVLTTFGTRGKLDCTSQGSPMHNVTHLQVGQTKTATPAGHGAPVTITALQNGIFKISGPAGSIGKIGPGMMRVEA
ncbi:hypothetical protein [uncultured Corynebacterium sp.]|uniref:hypothetical protein n=1 Tax=uncultured Corynebacterium sp. TaxID=159447 RepID=UPI0025CED8F7|nr:hypothetical protein [uncultured Corynebacterium sp.]